jgi:hypothetical protein
MTAASSQDWQAWGRGGRESSSWASGMRSVVVRWCAHLAFAGVTRSIFTQMIMRHVPTLVRPCGKSRMLLQHVQNFQGLCS